MFQALADPSRRTMVERLSRGPASVSELAKPFAMSLPAVVQHLQVLEASGLIRSEKIGRVRTCHIEWAACKPRKSGCWNGARPGNIASTDWVIFSLIRKKDRSMTKRSVTHDTFVLERSYPASPARVFFALSDKQAKAKWFGGPR